MGDFLALGLGHALVWALGVAIVLLPPQWRTRAGGTGTGGTGTGGTGAGGTEAGGRREGELAWNLGAGWFVGAFVLTLVMRAESGLGVAFARAAIGVPLLLALLAIVAMSFFAGAGAGSTLARTRAALRDATRTAVGADLPGVARGLWLALLAWLGLRFALLLVEVSTRPLYAWDTWMQWATKARVWFELRTLVPFAPFDVWLPANGAVYFDAAPHYPATVPLWQVWSALLIGRWDDSLTNLAWWCTALALCLAVYGFLRGAGGSRLFALVGAWLVGSLPMLNVHVALAGYADLPIAAYLTVAALAGWRWTRDRRTGDLLLLLICLAALPTIKNPGKAWLVLLLPGLAVGLWPRWGLRVALGLVAAGVLALLVLVQTSPVILGYRIQYDGSFPWQALVDAYFLYANWHLLWFAVIAVAILGWRSLREPGIASFTVTLGLGLLFLLFGFAFTNAAAWVEDQSTVNRATLHLAPLAVVCMLLVYRDWSQRQRPATAVAAPT